MDGETKLKGTLRCGFEYEIDMQNATSMRFIDALEESEENGLAFSRAIKILLGKDQREALYKYLEAQGQVPDIQTIAEIMGEIMQSSNELKK